VNVWQDGAVAQQRKPESGGPDDAVRMISDVRTLKAMADPIRLAVLSALMKRPAGGPRVMSVKELAAELGEPQTKLYRHVRQLEETGLIRAASSRMVSGILEQRYQACQRDLMLGPGLTRDEKSGDEAESVTAAALDRYRSRFFAARRTALGPGPASSAPLVLPAGQASPAGESYRTPVLQVTEARIPAARAAAIRDRLQEVIGELGQLSHQDDGTGVPIEVLIGFISPQAPDGASEDLPGTPAAGA
jgi:DNA-binding transcriptional ArsR family regulator